MQKTVLLATTIVATLLFNVLAFAEHSRSTSRRAARAPHTRVSPGTTSSSRRKYPDGFTSSPST
jgi:hypothetical protein